MNSGAYHEPVLVKEVIHYLSPAPGKVIIDCNLGNGGHALDILKQLRGEGILVGIDVDPLAVEISARRIAESRIDPAVVKFIVGNHADLAHLLGPAHVPPAGGILLDLGPSTPQLLSPLRGFSWESDEALDMRLNPQAGEPSAADIVNTWDEEELARIFREHAEERWADRIAKVLIQRRELHPIRTGRELGKIVGEAIPRKAWPPKIHPATRVFLALRVEVNHEYENLEKVLPQAVGALAPGGRLVVISFHGGEDSRVKKFMQELARPKTTAPWPLPQKGHEIPPTLRILTPQPVRPSEEEMQKNPRSRSARLRAAEKIAA